MLRYLIIPIFLFTLGCLNVNSAHRNWLILGYTDFGPQVIAHEIIGMDWWQWLSHGDPAPRDYPIKVVVYKDVPKIWSSENFS